MGKRLERALSLAERYQSLCEDKNDEIDRLREKLSDLEELAGDLYSMARNQLWIAYIWNDHNYPYHPEKYARQAAQEVDIKNLDDANDFMEKAGQLLNRR